MMSYMATWGDLLQAAHSLLTDTDSVRRAYEGCRTLEHVERTTHLLGEAALPEPPAWYRDHPEDTYIATLQNGQALTWTQSGIDEPVEIMAWSDPFQGDLIWRERR